MITQEYDLVIVGGGACGLLAAIELSKLGFKIALTEARDRFGGRIYTVNDERSTTAIELGAEFVHGDLPVTIKLLEEAGIRYSAASGVSWTFRKGELKMSNVMDSNWDLFEEKLLALDEDMTLQAFLAAHFPGDEFQTLRTAVEQFATGYDTADVKKVSSFALRNEWQGAFTDSKDYRIKGGYGSLVDVMVNSLACQGNVEIFLSSTVENIRWTPGKVEVITDNGKSYKSRGVVITVPLGVLKAKEGDRGRITFSPALPRIFDAVKEMGFGNLIKIILLFEDAFWERPYPEMAQMEFLMADAPISVWWTQFPEKGSMLTGWLGGPQAFSLASSPKETLLEQALKSLETIFNIPSADLREQLIDVYLFNWSTDPFTRGSYSYATIGSEGARKVLNRPIENTIFFAGEALYQGPEMGTVEAALGSALEVVRKIAGPISSL